jgi:hypothetical protein
MDLFEGYEEEFLEQKASIERKIANIPSYEGGI